MLMVKKVVSIGILIIVLSYLLVINKEFVFGIPTNNAIMKENNTARFFEGVEIQYETPEQREVIMEALQDMLALSEVKLRAKEYPDFYRKNKTIKIEQVINSFFVADDPKKALNNDFYKELCTETVRKILGELLDKLRVMK